ncbi:peptidoglycan-binding protein, partial [Patescibacteria group bacterium]|nr:peptidoglycan-binding protein [Patescibacteria group bacterium]
GAGDTLYGAQTSEFVKKLQIKYGITPAQGYFGTKTRTMLNAKYKCAPETGGIKKPLNVISPNGSEVFKRGSAQKITWVHQNTSTGTVNIDIESWAAACNVPPGMICMMAEQVSRRIASGISNIKVYEWIAGETADKSMALPDGKYVIRVTHVETGITDVSDIPFTIISGSYCYTFNTNLNLGSTGPANEALDSVLLLEGFNVKPDQSYGVSTRTAVILFQKKYGITPASGIVGPLTRAKLHQLYGCNKHVVISKINPSEGKIGTTVELTGIGFTPTSNNVYLASGVAASNINSESGTKLKFTIPNEVMAPPCNSQVCAAWYSQTLEAGTYPIKVVNANGTSNIVNFKIASSTTPTSSITIISPNGGEEYIQGSSMVARWSTQNVPSTAKIITVRLRNMADNEYNLISDTPNDGSETVMLPTTLPLGKYKLELKSDIGSGSFSDTSNNFFTIISGATTSPVTPTPLPYIRVVAPNGGESLLTGTSTEIMWQSSLKSSDNVRITLYKGSTRVKYLTTSTPNDGSYIWNVPSSETLGTNYSFRITKVGNDGLFDTSDASFSIVKTQPSDFKPYTGQPLTYSRVIELLKQAQTAHAEEAVKGFMNILKAMALE